MKYEKILVVILSLLAVTSCKSIKKEYDVTEFGAVGDSLTINTTSIQKAIDACSKNGGGTVSISGGTYISGTIILKDNVTLYISEGTKLIGSSNPLDYQSIDTFIDATGQKRGNCLIGSRNANNIGISGKGIIDGNGKSFLSKNLAAKIKELNLSESDKKSFGINRPFLLRFVKSSNILIQDINLKQPAAWTCHFYQSNNIQVNNINIYSHAHHNNDGIDLDSSYNATITNCQIDTGDDAICIKATSPLPTYNILVENCTLKSDWGALKFGTESMGDFHDIKIQNCKIHDTKGGGIKLLSVDGANIYNIDINNIKMNKVDMPIFIRLGERLRTYRDADKQDVGSIKSVNISNINATTQNLKNSRVSSPTGIFVSGTPNHKISSVSLENIAITLPGSEDNLILTPVEEQEKAYPEFSFFKVLPAYGLYARHIDSIKVSNVTFKTTHKDIREEAVFKNANPIFN
ncbi:glycosyl hydrolase family 28 protein [uncultured Algibacter sp.]|uniref:glycoside hydrolase family 28 protein n=1 Tax=uncultured Algibacter sp. TaxID=298659 RepID=UPI002627ED17|nr:glycosyl hydrolase family 28 protein [uncultured Algibacter sp.]